MCNEKQPYDLAFSLGYSCGASQALRDAGLQFASFPLDWTGSPSIVRSAEIVASNFANWIDRNALELVDVRHGSGFNTRIYRNRLTGIGFSHEFGDFMTFDESYPNVVETYNRRIKRLNELLAKSERILMVYLELPFRSCASPAEITRAHEIIASQYKHATFDLLYVYEDAKCLEPKITFSSDRVTIVALDYRLFDHGEITHFVRTEALTRYLRTHYAVKDYRTDDERQKRASHQSMHDMTRWGKKSSFRSIINRWAFRIYRHLEKYLISRELVQREGPLWFVDHDKGSDGINQ